MIWQVPSRQSYPHSLIVVGSCWPLPSYTTGWDVTGRHAENLALVPVLRRFSVPAPAVEIKSTRKRFQLAVQCVLSQSWRIARVLSLFFHLLFHGWPGEICRPEREGYHVAQPETTGLLWWTEAETHAMDAIKDSHGCSVATGYCLHARIACLVEEKWTRNISESYDRFCFHLTIEQVQTQPFFVGSIQASLGPRVGQVKQSIRSNPSSSKMFWAWPPKVAMDW